MKLSKSLRHGLLLVAGVVGLLTLHEAYLYGRHGFDSDYEAIELCIDQGGCWDKVDRICQKDESSTDSSCDQAFGR